MGQEFDKAHRLSSVDRPGYSLPFQECLTIAQVLISAQSQPYMG